MNKKTDNKELLQQYISMLRIRMVEEEIARRYNVDPRMMHTPVHLYVGQEAVAVGVCSQLKKDDVVFSNHRCHGHYLAKGGNLDMMIAELHSRATGCCKGLGGSMHLTDKNAGVALSSAIVAGNVPIATGYAWALKAENKKRVVTCFLGDGASEEGAVYESICFAKIHNLPIIYVCENNMYAVSTGFSDREPLKSVSDKFSTIIQTKQLDGNDVCVITENMKEILYSMRELEAGPVFLECLTYRLLDHHNTKTGIESGYRSQSEWDSWEKKSPIERARNILYMAGELDDVACQEIEARIIEEIHMSFDKALNAPFLSWDDAEKLVTRE